MILDGVKIEFGLLVDKTIATDTIIAEGSNPSEFSNIYDTLNSGQKQKIAYLETNYWLLDGSFVMPSDEDVGEIGGINNIAPDPSFESDAWQSETQAFSPYTSRFNISVTKSTEHVLSGSYSQRINFSYSGGSRFGTSVYAEAFARIKQSFNFQIGHKYYTRCYLFEENVESLQTGSKNYIGKILSSSKNGEKGKYISSIVNCSNYAPTEISIEKDVSFRTGYDIAEQYTIWFDDLLIVDLTEKYGAGNEPSIDVCDRIFNGQRNIIIGYESENVQVAELINYSFSNFHDSYGITIKFPSKNSIPRAFSIRYTNNGTTVGSITRVYDYDQEVYTNKETRLHWNEVIIQLSQPAIGQRARLQYIIFGTTDTYEEDELIEVSANKTISPLADYSESGEFSFSFFNNGRYDIETIKDLSQRVFDELKTQVFVKKNLQSAYELWGTYYVENGKVEENGHIVSFTAHDGLYRLDDIMYESGRVYEEGRSLADFARDVAAVAGVEIVVAPEFESIISYGYIAEVPCREAFRLIAEAGRGIFGVDGNDVFHIWTYDEKIVSCGSIGDTEIVRGTFSLNNSNKIMGIRITQYAFSKGNVPVEIGKIEGAILTNAGEKMVVNFSDVPVDPDTVEIIAINGQIENIQVFSNKVSFVLSGEESEQSNVTITGIPYTITESVIEKGQINKNVKEIKENFLITKGIGEEVSDFQNEHAVQKYNYSAEILTTKDVELGDVYQIEGNNVIVTDTSFSISYDDYSEEIQGVDR